MKRILMFLMAVAVSYVQAQPPPKTPPTPPDLYPVVGAPVGTPYPSSYVDLARDPSDVPPTALPDGETIVITAQEIVTFVAPKDLDISWADGGKDIEFKFFAFGGGQTSTTDPKIPAPFLRVTEGNTVNITS